ncbi:MAG: glycosyltransferase family 4 protein [Niameybacter sp.]
MNIGIFTDTYLPQINGVVSSIVTLEEQLKKQGHNVYIFTISHPHANDQKPYVYRIPSLPFVFLKDHRVGIIYSQKLVNRVKKLKLDIILSQTEFSLGFLAKLISKKIDVPIVHTYHTMYEEYMHYISKGVEFSPELARKYSKMFCNSVDGVVAPTEKTKDLLLNYGVKKPIEVIPTGINFAPFSPSRYTKGEIQALKTQFKLSLDAPTVLFVGRIAKEKSIDVVLEAFPRVVEKIPKAKFFIVGDGPEMTHLRELVTKLGLEDAVIFAGLQPWATIGKFYQLGDVFVSASVSETQGLTFAEAMAAGLPVVAKHDESIEALVENDYNGRKFSNQEELSQALIDLLEDERYRKTLSIHAMSSVAPLSDEIFGQNALAYYEHILALRQEEKNQAKPKKHLIKPKKGHTN